MVCQLLPNLDRSYSLVWGGRALLQYFEADQIRQLFHAAFPEVTQQLAWTCSSGCLAIWHCAGAFSLDPRCPLCMCFL